jgi:hypothetical protein
MVVVVVVVDSLEDDPDEEYPEGETGNGVRLRERSGEGDGIRSMISFRRSNVAGVGGRFLTGLSSCVVSLTGLKVCWCRNSWRSRSESIASSISRRRSCSY